MSCKSCSTVVVHVISALLLTPFCDWQTYTLGDRELHYYLLHFTLLRRKVSTGTFQGAVTVNALVKWNIPRPAMVSVCTDGAADAKAAGRTIASKYDDCSTVVCFSHGVSLSMVDAASIIQEVLDAMSKVMIAYNHSDVLHLLAEKSMAEKLAGTFRSGCMITCLHTTASLFQG